MTGKKKILIGAVSVIGIYSAFYFLIYKKRIPQLEITKYDWDKRMVVVRFGNTENIVNEFSGKTFSAGKTYAKNLYNAVVKPIGDGRALITVVNKDGSTIKEKQVNFDSRMVIDKIG